MTHSRRRHILFRFTKRLYKKIKMSITSVQIPISEFTYKYLWPRLTKEQLYNPGNALTNDIYIKFDFRH